MNWNILKYIRGIKGYENMSEERLVRELNKSELVKESARIKNIKKYFNVLRDRFSKLKIKEIRKDFYRTENNKNPST